MAELGETDLALKKIEALEPELKAFQPFHAAYASLLEQNGRTDDARQSYDKAIDLAQNSSSRKFLENRRRQLG